MKKNILLLLIAVAFTVYSCSRKADQPAPNAALNLPAQPYSYAVAGSAKENDKATLGRVLFYDKHLSLNNAIACASCHKQEAGFADTRAFSVGYEGRLTGRNSKSIINLGGNRSNDIRVNEEGSLLFWDGRESVLQKLVARPILNHVEMGLDVNSLPGKLISLAYYPGLFSNAYGDNTITMDRISECVALFLASIQSFDSRFDRFVGGEQTALSAVEQQGYMLFFQKYQCEGCHHLGNSIYSETDFFDIGLDNTYADNGLGGVSKLQSDNGKFRVPGLRNVAVSAPYMHDGRYKTLEEVIDHYSSGVRNSPNLSFRLRDQAGQPLRMNISPAEKTGADSFPQIHDRFRSTG
jgi:cytochrome c peroxidase